MAIESAADRLAFLDSDEFAVEATYTAAAGGTASPTGIFDDPHLRVVSGEEGVSTSDSNPTFCCRSADLPAAAAGGDAGDTLALTHPVTNVATTYRVADLQPDGTGMTLLTLAS